MLFIDFLFFFFRRRESRGLTPCVSFFFFVFRVATNFELFFFSILSTILAIWVITSVQTSDTKTSSCFFLLRVCVCVRVYGNLSLRM